VIEQDAKQLESLLRDAGRPNEPTFIEEEVAQLAAYYRLVLKWNPRLHLTTITSPKDFLRRHILESCFVKSRILPSVTQVWDIGSGLGIPGVVIAICRPNLPVYLVESSRKKALFLAEVIGNLRLTNVKVIEARFESLEALPENSCLTARAVEGMERMVPKMAKLAEKAAQILLLGSANIEGLICRSLNDRWQVKCSLTPNSDRRYLIEANRST
jgi:16S rRNA (guanine527-N7)-methyltransferase